MRERAALLRGRWGVMRSSGRASISPSSRSSSSRRGLEALTNCPRRLERLDRPRIDVCCVRVAPVAADEPMPALRAGSGLRRGVDRPSNRLSPALQANRHPSSLQPPQPLTFIPLELLSASGGGLEWLDGSGCSSCRSGAGADCQACLGADRRERRGARDGLGALDRARVYGPLPCPGLDDGGEPGLRVACDDSGSWFEAPGACRSRTPWRVVCGRSHPQRGVGGARCGEQHVAPSRACARGAGRRQCAGTRSGRADLSCRARR